MKCKFLFIIFLISFLSSCVGSENNTEVDEIKPNCGKIVRLYSQNESEGNPCIENTDYSRRFTIIVENNITNNRKNFCVNISVFIRYQLGQTYCDTNNPDSW